MNLRIEIELGFQDSVETLEKMLDELADVLKDYGYGNEDDDESYVKSFIRVRKLTDDEVILVVIPIKEKENGEKTSE